MNWLPVLMALALQEGGAVKSGEATIIKPDSTTTYIAQSSTKVIIDWRRFDIAPGSLVRFVQPSTSSIALNRVIGMDPSMILGSLEANGIVFLVNPNGVIFGFSAVVHTSGLVATTLSLNDEDFLAGRYRLTSAGPVGPVINQGSIVGDRFVVLAGPYVENSGRVMSPGGTVSLLGAGEAILQIEGDRLMSYSLGGAFGSEVRMAPELLSEPARAAINTTGLLEAASVVFASDGTVRLLGAGGLTINRGTLGTAGDEGGVTVVDSSLATVLLADSRLVSDAGSIQIRTRGSLLFGGSVEALSPTGAIGHILIDPPSQTIVPASVSPGVNQISELTISTMSISADVTVEADDSVIFQTVGGYTYFDAGTAPITALRTLTLHTINQGTVTQFGGTGVFWDASDTVAVPNGTLVIDHHGARVGGMNVMNLTVTGDNPILLEGPIALSGTASIASTEIVLGAALTGTAGSSVTIRSSGTGTLSNFFVGQGADTLGIRASLTAGTILLEAVETTGGVAPADVTIQANVTSLSANDMEILAGDSVVITGGTISSGGDLHLFASGFMGTTLDNDNAGGISQIGGTVTATGLIVAVAERGISLGTSGTLVAGDFTALNQGVGASLSPSGSISIRNTGDLTIVDTFSAGEGVVNDGGAIAIAAASDLTISAPVLATGSVTLTSLESGGADTLLVQDDVTSVGGSVFLRSGDNITLNPTTAITAATRIDIRAAFGDTDDTGAINQIGGTINAPQLVASAETGISLGASGTLDVQALQAVNTGNAPTGTIVINALGALELRVLDAALSNVAVRNDATTLSVTAGGTLTVTDFLYAVDQLTLTGGPAIVVNNCLFTTNGPFVLSGTVYPIPGADSDVTLGPDACFTIGLPPPPPVPLSTGEPLLVNDLLAPRAAAPALPESPFFSELALPKTIPGPSVAPLALFWREGGAKLAAAGADGVVRVWDAASGRAERSIDTGGAIRFAAVDSEGNRMVSSIDGESVAVRTLETNRLIKQLRSSGGTTAAAFSPDGTQLVLAGPSGLSVWDTRAWIEVTRREGGAVAIAFSPDGARFAAWGKDGALRLWDARTWELTHSVEILGAVGAFSPAGDRVATLDAEGRLTIVDTASGAAERAWPAARAMCVTFSRSGDRIVIGETDGSISVWDLRGTRETTLPAAGGRTTALTIDRAFRRLAAAAADGSIRIWQISR